MPEQWIKDIEALVRKLEPLPGPDYGNARQSLRAAAYWLNRAQNPPEKPALALAA